MTDPEIAAEIQLLGLEMEYLAEIAATLGFGEVDGWTEEFFEAMEAFPLELKREAALRVIQEFRSSASS